MSRLVLIRHGESQWNLENRFTGWVDVPSPQGVSKRPKRPGKTGGVQVRPRILLRAGSCQQTLRLVLEAIGQTAIPIERTRP